MRNRPNDRLRIGMLSTYPPTVCGLATFTAALEAAVIAQGHEVDIVKVDDGTDSARAGRRLAGVLRNGASASLRRSAAALSRCDVVVIQHEFGIFGGPDGDEILDVVRDLAAPSITVLHTVPQQASVHQAEILVELCEAADRVVVMSESARERLVNTYFPIDSRKVVTIPHGAALSTRVTQGVEPRPNRAAELLTWGLIGPGKGIENVIEALGLLHDLGHSIRYTIAGTTHPKVKAREGESYRNHLRECATDRGVAHLVTFDETYRTVSQITEFISSAGVVVLPYDTTEQVTSGVLVDSIAAGRPVISTRFPHAVELLSSGAGELVPHRDPRSLAVAIRAVTCEPDRRAGMEAEARALAPMLSWDAVAATYIDECLALVASNVRMSA